MVNYNASCMPIKSKNFQTSQSTDECPSITINTMPATSVCSTTYSYPPLLPATSVCSTTYSYPPLLTSLLTKPNATSLPFVSSLSIYASFASLSVSHFVLISMLLVKKFHFLGSLVMEVENKHSSGAAGMEAAASGREKEVMMANERNIRCTDLALRFLAFALTLVAAIVLGLDKETAYVSMKVVPTLPPLNILVTAKWHYLSAFVYFMVANSIACAYAAISLILMMANGGKRKGLSLLIIIFDVVMVAILFSGHSAAAAVGIIGAEGNSHVQWNKVCHTFAKFCRRGLAALSFSLAGSVVFLLLVLLATWNLMHRKH